MAIALKSAGCVLQSQCLAFPSQAEVAESPYGSEVLRVYQQLGGIQKDIPLRLLKWDIELEDVAVELDEDLHFNRYRRVTLQSSIYGELAGFPLKLWQAYCENHEADCLKAGSYGNKWTTKNCERQFGPTGDYRDLEGNGAPRWKQRAFYDFVKDITPLILGVDVVRISIWDQLIEHGSAKTVGESLRVPSAQLGNQLRALIESRRTLF